MKPTNGTEIWLLMAQISARSAQVYASLKLWDTAAERATQAGDYMKKVKWELVQ